MKKIFSIFLTIVLVMCVWEGVKSGYYSRGIAEATPKTWGVVFGVIMFVLIVPIIVKKLERGFCK